MPPSAQSTPSPARAGKAHVRRRSRSVVLPLVTAVALGYAVFARFKAAQIGRAVEELREADGAARPSAKRRLSDDVSASGAPLPPLASAWALEAERAAWRVLPKYSTHTCVGQKFYDNWHTASCKFDNVCLNASSGEVEYYVDPQYTGGGPGPYIDFDQSGNALLDFPATLLNPGHARIDTSVSWRPVVRRQRFPRQGPRVKWAPSEQALLHAFPPPLLWNFGHVMFDVLVPIFNMQHRFGLYDPSAQVLIPFAVNGSDEDLRFWLPRLVNTPRPEHSVLHLTYTHPAAWTREYAAGVLGGGQGLVCFRALLAGSGSLSMQQADLGALPYREAVVRHVGVREAPQDRPVITILNKKGRRMVENLREVAKLIRERYPRARTAVYDFAKVPDLTMRQQVQLMSDTSILITPCGGMATVLTFLRPQSTAIVFNYWNTHLNHSVQMEDNYYQHMEYLDFRYVPVTPADYEGTGDRPECELVEGGGRLEDAHYSLLGTLVHCSLRLRGEGLDRLMSYVDAAMLRWAARHGRHDVLKGGRRRPPSPPTIVVTAPVHTGEGKGASAEAR